MPSIPPGPSELGRSVVVSPGEPAPEPWARAPRIVVGPASLEEPGATVDSLHAAWAERRPIVIELDVGTDQLRARQRCDQPPYALTPAFELALERLQFLVWANAYDARGDEVIWWHGRKAARRFAETGVSLGEAGDITLVDGTPVFVDGGPSHPPRLASGLKVIHRWNAEAGVLRFARHGAPGLETPDTETLGTGSASTLAPDQLAAVVHGSGPARIIAPAGSGKTRVLTERLRHLIADRGVDPAAVTVLAYNAKAADELRDRCADIMAPGGPDIRTLNSIGLSICNQSEERGRLNVLDEAGARDLVGSVFEIRHRANTDTVVPYLEALSAIRLGLIDPDQAEETFPDAAGLADGFDRYRDALAAAQAVDFDEQIYRAIEILLTDPAIRDRAQERCRYLLVDEFQDLNPAHLLLIRLLNAPGFDCFGVGDDDQVLYGYSGATPEYLIHYDRYFPGAAHHALEVNYRCDPVVVDAAAHLLSYNRERVVKTIRSAPGRSPDDQGLIVRQAPGEQLASVTASIISDWRGAGGELADMAVLTRVNSALLPIQVALSEAGVPCQSTLTARVLGRTGVRTAFAYLRMGVKPERIGRRDIEDTVRRPSRGIAPNVVSMLTKRSHTSVDEIRRLAGSLSGRDVPKLEGYADDIERVALACTKPTADALRAIRVELGLGDTMDVLDASRDEPDRSTHNDDLQALESVAAFHPEVATFATWLRGVLERPQVEGPAILLSTVHRIKGREWDRVVIFGASSDLFPHRLAEDVEGERRVFHVALTRSKVQTVVLADAASPSFFVDELDGSRPSEPPERQARPPRAGPAKKASGRSRPGEALQPVEATAASAGLRAWRTEKAREASMPPYVILSDRHLEGIIEAAPTSLAALARCKGIGPMKLERWGDEILSVLGQSSGA
ncbi:MAG TPA: ATP-dependent DNA helicase UvrD2 [Acidimicrobiales bacterium]|nr:ATP-dependent DNA helicase UvrD2 [Acidimicrobiales bacterium]